MNKNELDSYHKNGYVVTQLHNESEARRLSYFATTWIKRLLLDFVPVDEKEFSLENYHFWEKNITPEHRKIFNAKNRYQYPPNDVMEALVNVRMKQLLAELGLKKYKIWDDGWGNVGFRMIRPAANDGYPLCTKEWGVAKGVVSFWVPIIGHSSNETLQVVPGSHLNDYKREVVDGKFAAGEPRFAGEQDSLVKVRPELKSGEVICYGSKTLHSEDVQSSATTRINLEIRFQPDN
jgi:hypothetical protein